MDRTESALVASSEGHNNMQDSDLPPYWPDTSFEKAFDAVWFTVTVGAGLFWLCTVIHASVLLFAVFKRRVDLLGAVGSLPCSTDCWRRFFFRADCGSDRS